ncbi:MAG TPA: hypothetical protein V6C99_01075 [Oculatellaceae cyanobacterium]|jgi:2'-5' RNA ligase
MTVYDVVLLPSPAVNQIAVSASRQLSAQYETVFTLESGNLEPHMSLYMATLDKKGLRKAKQELSKIAEQTAPLPLKATAYDQDPKVGMFEIGYETTPSLVRLQNDIVDKIAPLRTSPWPKWNPVGHHLDEWVPKRMDGEAKSNMQRYGYDEIGGLFRPHITLTRFISRGKKMEPEPLPPTQAFDDTFTKLALYEMGENGTCTKPVATFTLGEQREPALKRGMAAVKEQLETVRQKLFNKPGPAASTSLPQFA